jgi:hypothetical protein
VEEAQDERLHRSASPFGSNHAPLDGSSTFLRFFESQNKGLLKQALLHLFVDQS